MSKKAPTGGFQVPIVRGEPVYVLARHSKGAAMAASLALRGDGRVIGLTSEIREVDEHLRWRCINLPNRSAAVASRPPSPIGAALDVLAHTGELIARAKETIHGQA